MHWLTSPEWSLWSVTIANIWIGIPFNLVVLYSGLQAIDPAVHEAAALDGATGWQRFWAVILRWSTHYSAAAGIRMCAAKAEIQRCWWRR